MLLTMSNESYIQNLFADRLGLKFHTEQREGNIYALTLDSSGLKMTPNTSPENFQIPLQGNIDGFTRVMTTAIALETSKGSLALAVGLGAILLAIVIAVNALAWMVRRAGERVSG